VKTAEGISSDITAVSKIHLHKVTR